MKLNKYGMSAALAASLAAGTILAGSGGAHAAASLSCQGTYGRVAVPGQTAGWRVVESTAATAGGSSPGASVVSGRSDLWLFPDCGQALNYRSGTWRAAPLPAGTFRDITAAVAFSPSDVLAFASGSGSTEQVLSWNGRAWARVGQFPGAAENGLGVAAAAGPDSVWFSGGSSLWHFNGQSWARSSVPFTVTALSAARGGPLWAEGLKNTTPVVAELAGASWKVTPMARYLTGLTNEFCMPAVGAIYAQSADSVWVAGGSRCQDRGGELSVILRWNGRSWTALPYHGTTGEVGSIAPDGSGGLWISTDAGVPGSGAMLHLSGRTIVRSALPDIDGATPGVTLEASPGGGPVFGVGMYFAFRHNTSYAGSAVIEER